jgi:hypothetical protein
VSRCLAKNPDDRWQTARDLLAELKWIADTFETGAVRAVAVPTASTIGWRRVLLPAMLLAVAAAGLLWWRILPLGSHARPVVILMDSRLPERIYDPETRRNGGTNADDISDDLRDLDLEIHKETTSGAWHREDQVLEQNSSLIVMHLSSFADSQTESAEPHLSRDAQEKLRAFLGYIGMGNASTKFLIYTRRAPDAMDYAKWIAETETRFPALKGRVTIMFVPGGDEATFRDPATARDIGRRVKSMVTTR